MKPSFRFWTYVELYAIMMITWRLEVMTWHSDELSNAPAMIADILKFVTAAMIFVIFVLNNDVRFLLTDRYHALKSFA